MTYSKVLLLLLVISSLVLIGEKTVSATSHSAPDLYVNHASCYRSIYETDDLYCLTRYSLPTFLTDTPVSPEAWCAELVNTNGCIADPVFPEEPTSLPQNTAFISLYDNCTGEDCSSGDLTGLSRMPRIGYSIGGIYFSAGHSITWADSDVALCVEASSSHFGTTTQNCDVVFWTTVDNTETAQRESLGYNIRTQLIGVEVEQSLPANTYVERGLITSEGAILALEALPGANLILEVFAAVSTVVDLSATPLPGALPVQTEINTTTGAVASALTASGGIFNLTGEAMGTILTVISVLILFVVVYSYSDIIFASMASASFASVMFLLGFLQFDVFAVFISILALPAAVKAIRYMTGQNG